MQLQVNESGAWRKVAVFDVAKLDDVTKAARFLAGILQQTHAWRILDDDGAKVWHVDKLRRWREAGTP